MNEDKTNSLTAPGEIPAEQALCRSCGMCCDGTMFAYVPLKENEDSLAWGEITGSPPAGQKQIRQPCDLYSNGACRIYQASRPVICAAFACKLLIRFRRGGLSFDQAAVIIRETRNQADKAWTFLGRRASLNLFALFAAWEEDRKSGGPEGWKKENQAFLLDYAALRWRLARYFLKNDISLPETAAMPERVP